VKMEDVRGMSASELQDSLLALKKEAFNLRFQQAIGQLENTSRMREVRHDIARIKTAVTDQRRKIKSGDKGE